jgi:hypothetical protein
MVSVERVLIKLPRSMRVESRRLSRPGLTDRHHARRFLLPKAVLATGLLLPHAAAEVAR